MNDYPLSEDVKLTKLLHISINRKFSQKPTTNLKLGIKINIDLIVRVYNIDTFVVILKFLYLTQRMLDISSSTISLTVICN